MAIEEIVVGKNDRQRQKVRDSHRVQISLSDVANNRLEELAKQKGMTKSSIVAMLLDKYKNE
jgi:predicted DNA-binding protein